jgi:hypothetical protein
VNVNPLVRLLGWKKMGVTADSSDLALDWRRDLSIVLRRYGFLGLEADGGHQPITPALRVFNAALGAISPGPEAFNVIFADQADVALPGVEARVELPGQFLCETVEGSVENGRTAYRPARPHVSFSGPDITPIWFNPAGRTVIGWWRRQGLQCLLIGLNVVEELVRYTQGDPQRVTAPVDKTLWGTGNERATFLYSDHIAPGFELVPWADRLGFALARLLARHSRLPLVSPLPGGAKGAVLLTGDDDYAAIAKYEEQLRLIGDFPITYFMLPQTNHTSETLARLPASVEFGVHVDALATPDRYDPICAAQVETVRALVSRPARTVRNHGHLSRDYWGHLPAWESCGLTFSLNIRGVDGTCPTGSYLPFRVRRPDGGWSSHTSLFSTFSDSMYYTQKWSEDRQIQCISGLADQISRTFPGALVFNFHPQNVADGYRVHRAVVEIGRSPGWIGLGAESYASWLQAVENVRLVSRDGKLALSSPGPIERLALSWPASPGASQQILPTWDGELELSAP